MVGRLAACEWEKSFFIYYIWGTIYCKLSREREKKYWLNISVNCCEPCTTERRPTVMLRNKPFTNYFRWWYCDQRATRSFWLNLTIYSNDNLPNSIFCQSRLITLPNTKHFMVKNVQGLNFFCQSGEILPNLVALYHPVSIHIMDKIFGLYRSVVNSQKKRKIISLKFSQKFNIFEKRFFWFFFSGVSAASVSTAAALFPF